MAVKILITGAKGFIGKNLTLNLKNKNFKDILEYDIDTYPTMLDRYCKQADFVFHLAGVNRPEAVEDFMEGNWGFTGKLLEGLKKHENKCPVMISSSIQALLDNPYGKSKKAGEDLMSQYAEKTGAKVFIYRLPNVFGKWCRPNYNSAVATFCHNIARDLPVDVKDPSIMMKLVYIDDVVQELVDALENRERKSGGFYEVPVTHTASLGEIVRHLYSFKRSREDLSIPDMSDEFVKKLYSTYLSYIPEDKFCYKLKMNTDNRGSFTEAIKTAERGQISVNISKPGITKGNHWHNTKNEKFLVVSGKGIIKFRRVDRGEVLEYTVSGDKLEVVDIPVGYTHSITNMGDTDMVTVMWANEIHNPENPDTYFEEV